MDITKLSNIFAVRLLTEADIDIIYSLAVGNPLYYQHCPPFVPKESIAADQRALPPGMTYEDKYYIGFFRHAKLVAVMDLITGYPDSATAFIGFFMMDRTEQGNGIGSSIIAECCAYLGLLGYSDIRLGYAKGNPQSEAFWKKNGFTETGVESKQDAYTVVIMRRELV